MSRGHQVHRRRTYARRQHELHERRLQSDTWDGFEVTFEDVDERELLDTFDAIRPSGQRVFDLLAPSSRWLAKAS